MYFPLPCLKFYFFCPQYLLPFVQIQLTSIQGRYYDTKVPFIRFDWLTTNGLRTLERELVALVSVFDCPFYICVFINEMLRVVGKFFRLVGKDSASLMKDGRESSFLSSMSLRRQQMLNGYLFFTILSLFQSYVQLMVLLLQLYMSLLGVSKHNCSKEIANENTPDLGLLYFGSQKFFSYQGAKKTSSIFYCFRASCILVGLGKRLESITLGSGMLLVSPKQILLSLTLLLLIFYCSRAAYPLRAPQVIILISQLVKDFWVLTLLANQLMREVTIQSKKRIILCQSLKMPSVFFLIISIQQAMYI